MQAKDIKTGTVVVHNGKPRHYSREFRCTRPLLVVRQRSTNSRLGMSSPAIRWTSRSKEPSRLGEADFSRRNVQMMYSDATSMFLMDQEDYQQYELPLEDIQEQLPYITEGLEGMRAMIYNDACVGLEVPASVELLITECDPGVSREIPRLQEPSPRPLKRGWSYKFQSTSSKVKN